MPGTPIMCSLPGNNESFVGRGFSRDIDVAKSIGL